MLPHRQVALNAEHLVVVESFRGGARVVAVHHLEIFSRELERGRLKVYTSGGRGQHEVEVDVYHVSVVVQQDVAVVPVLHLQDVRQDGVPGERLDEVPLRLPEPRLAGRAKPSLEVLPQARAPRRPALDGVDGRSVGDSLDERRRGALRDDLEGTDPERQPGLAVNLAKLPRELNREELLPAVVSSLDDDRLEGPPGECTVRARRPNPLHLITPLLPQPTRATLPRARYRRSGRGPGPVIEGDGHGTRRLGPLRRQRGRGRGGVECLQRRVYLVVDRLGHLLEAKIGRFTLVRRRSRRSHPPRRRVLHKESHPHVAPLGHPGWTAVPAARAVAPVRRSRVPVLALVRPAVAREPRDAVPTTGGVPAARPGVAGAAAGRPSRPAALRVSPLRHDRQGHAHDLLVTAVHLRQHPVHLTGDVLVGRGPQVRRFNTRRVAAEDGRESRGRSAVGGYTLGGHGRRGARG